MLTETKKINIFKFIISAMDFVKVVLGLFLALIVFVLCVHSFELENAVPFYDSLNYFLQNLSTIFYKPRFSEEENVYSLIFLSVAGICLISLFELISSSISDMLKMFEKSQEEAAAMDNEHINRQIQKKYEEQLKSSFQFIFILKLVFEKKEKTLAFQDEKLEQENIEKNKRLFAELRTTIVKNINAKIIPLADGVMIQIPNAEILNRVLFYVKNLCQVPKYTSQGLIYYMSVTAYTLDAPVENAINEAKKLINLQIKNKIICYQVTNECLKLVSTNNFKAVSVGDFHDVKDSLYELVYKN